MSSFYTNVKQYRNKILVCGYENGKRFKREVKYRPYLFLPSDKESPYKTINGQGVVKQHFDSMSDAREFIKSYEDVDNFHIYGMTNFPYVYIFDNFRNVKYDPSLIKTCILDIEVSTEGGNPDIDAANKPVTAITAQYKDITFTFGYGDYRSSNNKVKYIKCKDEEDLLEKFVKLWSSDNYRPDVVTGWNIEFFDVPYLVRRISKLFSEDVAKKLSPWEHLEEKTVIFMGREQQVFIPTGLNILDYLHLYQKFTYSQQESYKLDHIANIELGEKKVDYSEYGNLDDLYNKNYQLFIDYNIHDCELIKRLDDKMKLLDLVYAFAYDAGINFADTLTSVRTWDVIIHNHLLTYKKVVPHVRRQESTGAPVGGFVKSPKIGMHEWVVSFDLTSLYPHLIMGYNISPDTFRGKLKRFGTMDQDMVNQEIDRLLSSESEFADHLKQNNVSMTPNSCTYTNEFQGFLGALMEDAFLKRKEYKKSMLDLMKQNDDKNKDEISKYHNLQMAKKIQLNSCYGALANQYFRWYDIKYAESITTAGQLTIRWAEKYINKFMNEKLKTNGVDYVIAVDTDSLYLDMSGIAKASGFTDKTEIHNYLQKISEETINPFFERVYDKLAKRMNCYKQAMDMKLEIVSDRSIFVAKKRYIANVLSSEGVVYEKPKLKVMGIEAVRSSTPQVCRDAIKEALKIIMTKTEDDLRDYVNEFKERFKTLSFEEVAFPRGINGLEKYKDSATIFKKGTPIHVRGALVYNNMLIKKGLHIKEPMVFDRDKIKFCYLVTPNPSHSNVISAPVTPSKELNLDKYIDYNLQFEKSFVEPIKTIIESVGWELEKRATLRRFFE